MIICMYNYAVSTFRQNLHSEALSVDVGYTLTKCLYLCLCVYVCLCACLYLCFHCVCLVSVYMFSRVCCVLCVVCVVCVCICVLCVHVSVYVVCVCICVCICVCVLCVSVSVYVCVCPHPAVQSLNSLNDQIAHFMVTGPQALEQEDRAFLPSEKNTLHKSMTLMRHLLADAQVRQEQDMTSRPLLRSLDQRS